ncbi:MAG: primosomal protein N' [Treponema sp.]
MARWLEIVFKLPLFQSFFYCTTVEDGTSPVGKRAAVPFGSRKLTGFITAAYDTLPARCPFPEAEIKPIHRIIDAEPLFCPEQVELARWLSRFYICPEGQALSAMLPSGKREAAELNTGGMDFAGEGFSVSALTLSAEQKTAVEAIGTCTEGTFFYVYGITGSGKTEVFLQAASRVLAAGKAVIYLVPEITLSHQVAETVQERFGSRCAVLHSGLSGSKRLAEWRRIMRGEAQIVVGVRSAVFAPVRNLGLIIIDEEHDGSYKSGFTPRYHARQVAMYLCTKHGCPLVMGSATPSVEAWYMMKKGLLRTLPLTKRLSGGALPRIRIESLVNTQGVLSGALITEMRRTKAAGKQTIVFLNRRGFSHFFTCKNCGHELLCKNCSVPLTLHKSEGLMKCHYCGWKRRPPSACPECGSIEAGYTSIGTEYIEEQVRKTFPDCTIQRIDTDVLQKNKQASEILTAFRDGHIDILLGTQMIAKGLNFPAVRLVGIALADTGLQMPDFRAAERTFSLIMQVAGRAGRYVPDGEVIIQTYNPYHPAIVCAQHNDAEGFYAQELHQREVLEFPPFTRLIRLVFRSKDAKKAEEAAYGALSLLHTLLSAEPPVEVLGPSECMLAQVAGNYRMQLLLRSSALAPAQKAVFRFITEYKPAAGVYIETDVDPVSLL